MSVQDSIPIVFLSLLSVSIHHMCRFKQAEEGRWVEYWSFNTSYVSVQEASIIIMSYGLSFQYIICVGSSETIKRWKHF